MNEKQEEKEKNRRKINGGEKDGIAEKKPMSDS
jgi:hypothetical protein